MLRPSCVKADSNCIGTGCLPRQRRLSCVLFSLNLWIPILRHRSRNILNHGFELMDRPWFDRYPVQFLKAVQCD